MNHHDKNDNVKMTAELSLKCSIDRLWKNRDKFFDLHLQSMDDVKIPIHKSILAARSPVFEKLLYGNYSEANQSVVKVGCDSKVLHEIVKYCYTDTVGVLSKDLDTLEVGTVTDLYSAAEYFGFRPVSKSITGLVSRLLQHDSASVWSFLCSPDIAISDMALKYIRSNLDNAISNCFPPHISESKLEEVLTDKLLVADEIDLFRLIHVWFESSTHTYDEVFDVQNSSVRKKRLIPTTTAEQYSQKAVAMKLIDEHIQLSSILPSDIQKYVEPSGLVTPEQILEADRYHACLYEKESDLQLPKTARGPCWEDSISRDFTCKSDYHITTLLKSGLRKRSWRHIAKKHIHTKI